MKKFLLCVALTFSVYHSVFLAPFNRSFFRSLVLSVFLFSFFLFSPLPFISLRPGDPLIDDNIDDDDVDDENDDGGDSPIAGVASMVRRLIL